MDSILNVAPLMLALLSISPDSYLGTLCLFTHIHVCTHIYIYTYIHSTVVVLWVVDRWQGSLISSSAVAEFLNRPSTRVALRLAGLSVLSASTEQG